MSSHQSDIARKFHDALKAMNAASGGPGRKRPHKACMMLAVIELIEAGKIVDNNIPFSDVLISRYRGYFEIVKEGNDTLNPWLPFFHLRGESFWRLVALPGREAALEAMSTATKKSDIENNVVYAELDSDLFTLLNNPMERDLLRDTIVLHWFAPYAEVLREHVGVTEFELILQAGRADSTECEFQSPVRSSAFRRLVIEAYDFRCAATGWRIIMPDYSTLVDAAHLIPFSETNDDRPQNGMALTPTFHRALDKGLIAPGPDLKWHVSKQLDRIPDNQPLIGLEGAPVRQPRDKLYHADKAALEWRMGNLL